MMDIFKRNNNGIFKLLRRFFALELRNLQWPLHKLIKLAPTQIFFLATLLYNYCIFLFIMFETCFIVKNS